jgi:peptidoglycan-associated lipoprotein
MQKQTQLNAKLVIALSMAILLVACKSTPMVPAKVEDKSPTAGNEVAKPADPNTAGGTDTSGVKEVVIDSNANNDMNSSALRDPKNILSKRKIYFDYNSDAVKEEYRPLVDAHGKYLIAHPDAKMILQGNTDEKGSREYNLSLGQRRSVSVKKALNLLGVQDKQIETVSYGEEKATQNCSGETCDKDRRVDIVHEGE